MNTSTSPATLSTDTKSADVAPNISSQPVADIKPLAQWDEDEIFDGRPRAPPSRFSSSHRARRPPGAAPYARTLDNDLDTMQTLIGGYITSFDTGLLDTVGIAHDEGLLL